MKKTVSLVFTVMLTAQCLMAQFTDGIKYLNYQKNISAKNAFQKAYDANPKDPQAIYWLGQALLATDGGDPTKEQVDAAKALYQKGLTDAGSDAWLLVGMGHVEILQKGDINSVKQKFEQAITATTETKGKNKGKPNPAILNAIGRANAYVSSNLGDHAYAIDKLKQAAAIDLTNADIMINLGINYLKLGGENGGDAVKAYQEAITRDPKNAYAMYRIGKIYQSQNNKDLFETNFNNAIAADPAFPLAYYAYYQYYAEREVNKAKEYLDKFVASADKDPRNEYFLAEYLFRAGKNAESIAKAKELEASAGLVAIPRISILYAYNYDRMNDSVQAKANIEKFFAAAPADKIVPTDYELAVKVLSKFPGNDVQAISYIQKAIDSDTSTVNKINYMKLAADINAKSKNYPEQFSWLKKAQALKPTVTSTDYYYLTDAAIKAKDYPEAVRLGDEYVAKYPDQMYGYRVKAIATVALDADTSKGTAIPAVQAYIDFLSKDPAKNSRILPYQFYYLASYYHDKAKDFQKTIDVLNALLALYPEDKYGLQVKPIVEKELAGPPPKPVKGGATTGNGASPKG